MASDSENDFLDDNEEVKDNNEDGDDLFGSDDEDEQPKARELSDRELDSGDDEDRSDRAPEKEQTKYDTGKDRDARILENTIPRHPLPNPSDGEFNTLRLPSFLGIDPYPYNAETFQLPTTEHHSAPAADNFSARAVAETTIRFRKDPSTGKLESNTVMQTWSDGSTTISVGGMQYELQTKSLAPPKDNKTYEEVKDSHQYVASPSIYSQLLLMVGHMTKQYTVRPNTEVQDDAVLRLKANLETAFRGRHKNGDGNGLQIIETQEDPERARKKAEQAEKEHAKQQRRNENAQSKLNQPSGRRMGGGLNLDDLEGRAGGRRAPTGRKSGPKRPRNRRDYSSDEEEDRGRGREDKYALDDGFLVGSDEEVEEDVEDSEGEEEEESEEERPRAKKQKRTEPESNSDEDAPGDLEDEPPAASEPVARGRKRNIVESDEDE